ncbi:50S ribosomal protein L10 [Candidatus Pacearchaeota archaeon]|nr:50S ribosomal protein L10 [Candidatus Pacearchaeota archaeon]
MKTKKQITTHVSEGKKKVVKELIELIKTHKTMLVASIKGLPAAQFQEVCKKLRGKAVVKVPKKNLIIRAIDDSKVEKAKELEGKFEEGFAIMFSNQDSFDLALELIKKKVPARAKPGQEAPEDIVVPAGPTDLPPGPAISELGALGIMVQIDKGKISIKEPKVIVKAGNKISQAAADVMSKLDIKPFTIGVTPLAAYDSSENKVYLAININPEEALEKLKTAYGKSLPFAVAIGYTTSDTIKFILSKAQAHANKLNRIMTGEPEPVAVEQKSESHEIKKEEHKAPTTDALAGFF